MKHWELKTKEPTVWREEVCIETLIYGESIGLPNKYEAIIFLKDIGYTDEEITKLKIRRINFLKKQITELEKES